jgi:hypothetical protein
MIKQLNHLAIVFTLSTAMLAMAPVSFTEVGYLAYASKDKSNCSKNNSGNQVTVQSASQVAIGNNIKQIVIQNGDQKSIADNKNNTNCKHTHINHNNSDGIPTLTTIMVQLMTIIINTLYRVQNRMQSEITIINTCFRIRIKHHFLAICINGLKI